MQVFRIQDQDGRGPFKPGFSQVWCDPEFAPGQKAMPPWGDEFGWDAIERLARPGEHHFGSAVLKLRKLREWFSGTEQACLSQLGYHIAAINHARVMAESENQVLIASRIPFNRCIIIPWFTPQEMIA